MLAAHRDQENLVHSHQAVNKQHPKTPGARYPKTPTAFARNDENAAITRATKNKTAVGGPETTKGSKHAANRHAMMTPMENRARAPLGNKTTNAKAGTIQTVGVKDRINQIERTHGKTAPTVQKSSKKLNDGQMPKLRVQPDITSAPNADGVSEPEYAPPPPVPLPYESDVLPKGGLTFHGLESQNLFKGFYHHFHNPVDENGVSRMEKKFNKEMEAVLKKVEERNAEEMESIHWNPEDLAENASNNSLAAAPAISSGRTGTEDGINKPRPAPRARSAQRHISTVSSRRAASALAAGGDKKTTLPSPSEAVTPARRPLSTLISRSKPAKPIITAPRPSTTSTGEVASRTTLGYTKGRTASSMVHSAEKQHLPVKSQAASSLLHSSSSSSSSLTNTPRKGRRDTMVVDAQPSPRFVSIFDDSEDGDLPPLRFSFQDSCEDDKEEEFQLRLDI